MTLNQLLTAMAGNTNTNIALIDSDDSAMITFNASGYASIESDLLSRTVSTITIGQKAVTVKLTANA